MDSSTQIEGEVGSKKGLNSAMATVANERELAREVEDCQAALRVHLKLETINLEWHQGFIVTPVCMDFQQCLATRDE